MSIRGENRSYQLAAAFFDQLFGGVGICQETVVKASAAEFGKNSTQGDTLRDVPGRQARLNVQAGNWQVHQLVLSELILLIRAGIGVGVYPTTRLPCSRASYSYSVPNLVS